MGILMGQTALVLASGSPRRRAFLEQLGLTFTVSPADLDERVLPGEAPEAYVARLAREKALAVRSRVGQSPGARVLAADTTVVLEAQILGKPAGEAEARTMLRSLCGREHRVLTGVALAGREVSGTVVETFVRFRDATDAELAWYVATQEPLDKAGAYAIQGVGGFLVEAIRGSYSNVVGLPLAETLALLAADGLALPWHGEGKR
jgi:septum formation protein